MTPLEIELVEALSRLVNAVNIVQSVGNGIRVGEALTNAERIVRKTYNETDCSHGIRLPWECKDCLYGK